MPRATHHHNSDNQIGREHAQRLLTELWRLRSETHSAGSILKDASAVQALKLASTLFDFLAGWARDHVIGRELRGIPSAPYARGTERERSLGSERPWDDPELEHLGSHYDFADDHANQRILIELVHRCAPVLGGLSRQLMDAFAELQSGGNHGLVSPTQTRGKNLRELARLRIRALEHSEFRRGLGRSKQEALTEVIAVYGVGNPPDTDAWKVGEQWQQRMRRQLGKFRAQDTLTRAFRHGEWFKHLSISTSLALGDEEFLRDIQ
jgi:hypothetical protein